MEHKRRDSIRKYQNPKKNLLLHFFMAILATPTENGEDIILMNCSRFWNFWCGLKTKKFLLTICSFVRSRFPDLMLASELSTIDLSGPGWLCGAENIYSFISFIKNILSWSIRKHIQCVLCKYSLSKNQNWMHSEK